MTLFEEWKRARPTIEELTDALIRICPPDDQFASRAAAHGCAKDLLNGALRGRDPSCAFVIDKTMEAARATP